MLIAITGLPGSGKSTFAQSYFGANSHPQSKCPLFETDEFFYEREPAKPGIPTYQTDRWVYRFDPEKLGVHHLRNQERTRKWLSANPRGTCCVANTFSQHWELEPYVKIAAETHHLIKVYYCDPDPLTLEDLAEQNLHGVPLERLIMMDQRWEPVKSAMTVYPYRTMARTR
jgi:hypothetical protein